MCKQLFGLTGGIGSGKSTVARFLATYPGVTVIDCDLVAKEIISSASHIPQITALLGEGVASDGKPDTKKIADCIFGNVALRSKLEAFMAPLIAAEIDHRATSHITIVESAIIYEKGWESRFDCIITVTASDTERKRRLRECRGMDEQDIERRWACQLPQEEKLARSDISIDTTGDPSDLPKKVTDLYRKIIAWNTGNPPNTIPKEDV